MEHTVISAVNIKFFINRKLDNESWHCSIDPGSNTDNVSQLPPHRTESIFSVPMLNISRSNLFLLLL